MGSKTRIGVRRVRQCEFRLQACVSGSSSLLMPHVIRVFQSAGEPTNRSRRGGQRRYSSGISTRTSDMIRESPRMVRPWAYPCGCKLIADLSR
jgi:hypothetical protein